MDILQRFCDLQNRRQFLARSGMGLGATALATSLPNLLAKSKPAINPKAKRVIFLFMAGGPSQLDLFDYKPDMHKIHGKPLPKEISGGQRVTLMTKGKAQIVCSSAFKFSQHGQSGNYFSELLPHLSTEIDELCLIKSTHTNAINHDPAQTFFCTGSEMAGKASMGAWLSYGLGSMNRDLPDFVVLSSAFFSGKVNVQALYSKLWGNGFLPSKHQGVAFQSTGDPVLFLSNPKGVDREARRKMLDLVTKLNRNQQNQTMNPEIETSISQQEMAFRMQISVPELTDFSKENKTVIESYGPEVHKPWFFCQQLLTGQKNGRKRCTFHSTLSSWLGPPWGTAPKICGASAWMWTNQSLPYSRILDKEDYLRIRWLYLPENSDGPLMLRVERIMPITAGTITPDASPHGWPEQGLKKA
jgi:hypothetical protein